MAHTSCAAELAANIAQSCNKPNVGGYTGRGIYIPKTLVPTLTFDATNTRKISAIALATNQKAIAIDNVMTTPFEGSATEMTSDNGWGQFQKSLAVRIPLKGADASRDVIEPLLKSALGGLLIVEKRYQGGDGSFEVIGVESGAKCTELTRNENENGGDWSATLQATESVAEYTLYDTDYATTLAKFEALLGQTY